MNPFSLKSGLSDALPLIIGFFPISMAFGMMAKTTGVSFADTCLFSLLVFAGASQFMALDLLNAGIATIDIILATFLLNLRHLMMSASLSVQVQDIQKKWLPFIAFGITDESFSVASLKKEKLSSGYLLALQSASYVSWVVGTLTGYLIGSALPAPVQGSLGLGLYGMFTAILVPEIKKSSSVLCLAALSGLLYYLLAKLALLPSGWNLIAGILLASLSGSFLLPSDVREEVK